MYRHIDNELIQNLYRAIRNKALVARLIGITPGLVFRRLKKMKHKEIERKDYIETILLVDENVENPVEVGRLLRTSYKEEYGRYPQSKTFPKKYKVLE